MKPEELATHRKSINNSKELSVMKVNEGDDIRRRNFNNNSKDIIPMTLFNQEAIPEDICCKSLNNTGDPSLPKGLTPPNMEVERNRKSGSSQGSFVVISISDDLNSVGRPTNMQLPMLKVTNPLGSEDKSETDKRSNKSDKGTTKVTLEGVAFDILRHIAVAIFLLSIPATGVVHIFYSGISLIPLSMPIQLDSGEVTCESPDGSILGVLHVSIPARVLFTLLAPYLISKMWQIRDKGSVHLELRAFFVLLVPYLLLLILCDFYPFLLPVRHISTLFMSLYSLSLSTLFPIHLSHEEKKIERLVRQTLITFDHVLTDPNAYPQFKHFVTLQMYPEYLEFYQDYFDLLHSFLPSNLLSPHTITPESIYKAFRLYREHELAQNITLSPVVHKKVKKMYKKFVVSQGGFELQISDKVKEKVVTDYGKRFRHPVIFLPVWKEVYEALFYKSFRLYCRRIKKA
jgi:hypothetical protein